MRTSWEGKGDWNLESCGGRALERKGDWNLESCGRALERKKDLNLESCAGGGGLWKGKRSEIPCPFSLDLVRGVGEVAEDALPFLVVAAKRKNRTSVSASTSYSEARPGI